MSDQANTEHDRVPVLVVADPGYVGQDTVADELGERFEVAHTDGLEATLHAAAERDHPIVLLPANLEPVGGARILGQLAAQGIAFVGALMFDAPDAAALRAQASLPGVHVLIPRPLQPGALALYAESAANQRAALRASRPATQAPGFATKELLHTLRHEVRGQLQGVVGLSGLLVEFEGDKLSDEARSWCRRMETSGERIARLIDDIVAHLRLGQRPLERAWIDVAALVEEQFDELRFDAGDPARLDLAWCPPNFRVWADRRLLSLALDHLVTNALNFNLAPTRRVRVGVTAGDQRGQRGGGFTLWIEDDGPGIRASDRQRVFALFEKRHVDDEDSTAGAGIGLATVAKIAAMHGGDVHVDEAPSELGGARLLMWFPDPAE